MDRSDWVGLGTSVGLHVLMLVLFAFMTGLQPQPQPLGFVEVEFGDFAEGRPVEATPEPEEEPASEATEPEPEPEEPEEEEEPVEEEETEPVDLPERDDEVEEPEDIPEQDEEAIPPEPEPEEEEAQEEENEADDVSGAESGDSGEGAEEEAAAPYDIEGLDRDPVYAPMPQYAEQVDATIRVRITVDPRGRIVQRVPLLKGNPTLEKAVMDALQRWRFNSLPANAPQENQTGVITFRFRLE